MEPFRALDKDFMKELLNGKLKYVLQFERSRRKSFMVEIRNNFLDLYFLGHSIEVKRTNKTGYYLAASKTFDPCNCSDSEFRKIVKYTDSGKWQILFDDIKGYRQFERLIQAVIARIVIHKEGDISEGVSELNHFIDNRAIGRNGTLIIDRQVVYPGVRENRIDLLGITRLHDNKDLFTFSIIELKNKNNPQIGEVFAQTSRYIDLIYDKKEIYDRFKITYMTVIDQKKKLGLLKSIKCNIASRDEISKQDIKGVVVLDNFNIKRDIQQDGLLQRAIQDWARIPKVYDIKLFMKTNVLDSVFFSDINDTRKLLEEYKKCNL